MMQGYVTFAVIAGTLIGGLAGLLSPIPSEVLGSTISTPQATVACCSGIGAWLGLLFGGLAHAIVWCSKVARYGAVPGPPPGG